MSYKSRFMFGSLIAVTLCGLAACDSSTAQDNPPGRRGQGRFGMGGAGGSALGLLRIDVVQNDLKLTDDEKASIQKLQDAARDNRTALQGLSGEERTAKMQEIAKDQDAKIAGILDDKQKARLKEIRLQSRGAQALTDKELAEALKLTDDQVNKIKEIVDAMRKEMQDAFQSAGQGGDRTAMRDKMTKLRKDTDDKILAVLTPDQKTSYDKMLGAKIDLPQGAGFGGRGGPGGGRGGQGGGGRRNRGGGGN
jgi:Spy/CpxP family protein refolding chaperone